MEQNRKPNRKRGTAASSPVPDEFVDLWQEADKLWDQHRESPGFFSYVSADFAEVFSVLEPLSHRVTTFLEWGSGLGVVTMMASRLGIESYGIEAEAMLVNLSASLASTYAPEAQFAQGSFIPGDFDFKGEDIDELSRTLVDVPPAYDQLDIALSDADLVYAYPWPGEHELYHRIMREFARPDAIFLTYDAREGVHVAHCSEL